MMDLSSRSTALSVPQSNWCVAPGPLAIGGRGGRTLGPDERGDETYGDVIPQAIRVYRHEETPAPTMHSVPHKMYVTVAEIKSRDPCTSGWREFVAYAGLANVKRWERFNTPINVCWIMANNMNNFSWIMHYWPLPNELQRSMYSAFHETVGQQVNDRQRAIEHAAGIDHSNKVLGVSFTPNCVGGLHPI